MTTPDPRVRIVLDAAEGVVAALAPRIHAAHDGEDWSPSTVVAMLLAAAHQASNAPGSTMSREQYIDLVRGHADTVKRLPREA